MELTEDWDAFNTAISGYIDRVKEIDQRDPAYRLNPFHGLEQET